MKNCAASKVEIPILQFVPNFPGFSGYSGNSNNRQARTQASYGSNQKNECTPLDNSVIIKRFLTEDLMKKTIDNIMAEGINHFVNAFICYWGIHKPVYKTIDEVPETTAVTIWAQAVLHIINLMCSGCVIYNEHLSRDTCADAIRSSVIIELWEYMTRKYDKNYLFAYKSLIKLFSEARANHADIEHKKSVIEIVILSKNLESLYGCKPLYSKKHSAKAQDHHKTKKDTSGVKKQNTMPNKRIVIIYSSFIW